MFINDCESALQQLLWDVRILQITMKLQQEYDGQLLKRTANKWGVLYHKQIKNANNNY